MDDPAREAELITPWEYKHLHPMSDHDAMLIHEHRASLFPGAGLWPMYSPGGGYYFPPRNL